MTAESENLLSAGLNSCESPAKPDDSQRKMRRNGAQNVREFVAFDAF